MQRSRRTCTPFFILAKYYLTTSGWQDNWAAGFLHYMGAGRRVRGWMVHCGKPQGIRREYLQFCMQFHRSLYSLVWSVLLLQATVCIVSTAEDYQLRSSGFFSSGGDSGSGSGAPYEPSPTTSPAKKGNKQG